MALARPISCAEQLIVMAVKDRLDLRPALLRLASAVPPLRPYVEAWHHRSLISRLARREIQARYRGSVLGLMWTLLVPLFLLVVYAFVFSVIFAPRWELPPGGRGNFALLLFSGLIVFQLFAECVSRAPGLVLENPSYVKRVVFPLPVLPWVSLAVAAFGAAMSTAVLALFYAVSVGMPPLSVLWLPTALVPLALLALATSWFLAALGVFLRDLRPLVGVVVSSLYFLSPVFYPLTAIPERYRWLAELNPLAVVLEGSKAALFYGVRPNVRALAVTTLVCLVLAWAGHACFRRLQPGFADVV